MVGYAPWSYGDARSNVDGVIRLDYFPLWAAFGLVSNGSTTRSWAGKRRDFPRRGFLIRA